MIYAHIHRECESLILIYCKHSDVKYFPLDFRPVISWLIQTYRYFTNCGKQLLLSLASEMFTKYLLNFRLCCGLIPVVWMIICL